MVAPLHDGQKYLGFTMPTCLARNYLDRANELFQAGDVTAAGCYCREALRRLLESLCIYHDCLPKKFKTPSEMVEALLKAKVIDKDDRRLLRDLIATCNKAAHAQRVRKSRMDCTICLAYNVLDAFPALAPYERVCQCGCKAKPDAYDDGYSEWDDIDDPADWWKRDEEGGAE